MHIVAFILLHFHSTQSSTPQDVIFGDEVDVVFGDETVVYFG